jgi:16S rRNA (guanine527-N7)-methyltransferase
MTDSERDPAFEDSPLVEALDLARHLGYLGPGPIDDHITHSLAFADVVEVARPFVHTGQLRCLDLGSGGGVPGLVLLRRWKHSRWTFVDTNQRRMVSLGEALESLAEGQEGQRGSVYCGRAEDEGRRAKLRGQFDIVVARGFASPAVTAECAAPFLKVDGLLVVSEPPEDRGRWSAEGLAVLGLSGERVVRNGIAFFVAVQNEICPDRYPRRVGIPGKRPLF